jgi:hypothetical protein
MARMTLREAAERAGISVTTLRRYIRAGRLSADKRDGRFGPEYTVSEEELTAAGLDLGPLDAPRALVRRGASAPLAQARDEEPAPLTLRDVVPLTLFQELQMKHEQLLVQYGMMRAGGLRSMELQAEIDSRTKELEGARESVRRLRHDAEAQAGRLREAALELHGRSLEIDALREKVRALEMLTRNAVTTEAIDKQFRAVVDQTRRVQELGAEGAAGPRLEPDH